MNTRERICAYYSHGPHFTRMLKALRAAHPDAEITAMVPPGYPHAPLAGLADAVVEVAKPATVSGALGVLRRIRAGRYDCLAMMFDSPKLRLLAALSGVPRRVCHSVDRRQFPLKRAIIAPLMGALWRNLRGRILYRRIRYIVDHYPVERDGSDRSGRPV